MSNVTISVVLPTYNHLTFLKAAIDDIYRQTRQDWELIVVNDGSTDGTRAWLDEQSHPKLRVIHQENKGAWEAINTGMRAARGRYVTWISADNRCMSYFLEALSVPLDRDPECKLVYSAFYAIDAADRVFAINYNNLQILRELLTDTHRGNAGFLYRREMHDQVGYYETWVCDTLMWARITDGSRSVFVVEPTYYYRIHGDCLTMTASAKVEADKPFILKDFLGRHNGQIDRAALFRLYPGLSCLPQEYANHDILEAATDFAARMFNYRAFDTALVLLLSLLGFVGISSLYAPMVTFLSCCLRLNIDPMGFLRDALNCNASLSAEQRQSMIALATQMHDAAKMGFAIPQVTLSSMHRLLKLERPNVFSYTAWREQNGLGAVPGGI